MSYYRRSKINIIFKNCDLKTGPLMFLQRIKHNLYWKMKYLKQATYIRSAVAKLSEFIQISMQSSSDSFYRGFLENWKGPGTSFQAIFFTEDFNKKFSSVIIHKLARFHYQTVYSPSYSVKCVFYPMLRHLMMSWNLNIWKVKIWLPQEQKELSKWNNFFPCF